MKKLIGLFLFSFLALGLSASLPLVVFFAPNDEESIDRVGRVGELVSLAPSFESRIGGTPKLGVKSARLLESAYAIDSYGYKYKVLAVEIAWNDASVNAEFTCDVEYRDRQNHQEWSFKRSAYVVDFKGGIEIPETFVPRDQPWSSNKEDACGILHEQMNQSEQRRKNSGPNQQIEVDVRRSVTEFIPVPEPTIVDDVVITVRKPVQADSYELDASPDEFKIQVEVS